MAKILVIGIDAATWDVIKPNLGQLPNFKKLMEEGEHKTITQSEQILSASIWCSMFSGKTLEEHNHKNFVIDEKLQSREDIKINFIWDELKDKYDIRALQVPFVMPPYNFNCQYTPVGYGTSSDLDELDQDTDGITFCAVDNLKKNPDVFIVCYTALDKVQHFHWGEPLVLSWYKKIDQILEMLTKYGEKLIIISDHGFCGKGEARERTLPDKTPEGELKGDHHQDGILITKNIKYKIREPKDVFYTIKEEVNAG